MISPSFLRVREKKVPVILLGRLSIYARFSITHGPIWRHVADKNIVAALSRQLGWSHFVELIAMGDSFKRNFYAEMCRIEKWNVRTLRNRISGMLFERTGLSKKPE